MLKSNSRESVREKQKQKVTEVKNCVSSKYGIYGTHENSDKESTVETKGGGSRLSFG